MPRLEAYDFETTPSNVVPEQVGRNYNPERARKEAKATINQLIRMFGEPPAGTRLKIKSNPHDFGNYYSIQFLCESDDNEGGEYMAKLDNNWPEEYDAEALAEIGDL